MYCFFYVVILDFDMYNYVNTILYKAKKKNILDRMMVTCFICNVYYGPRQRLIIIAV